MKLLITVLALALLATTAGAVTCTPTGFFRDGINLTAAQINPAAVAGTVDATGCNIGVYYDSGSGSITNADIFGSNYFGVVNNGATVNITNSSIHNIGEVPVNGTQHGVAIYYTGNAAGVIGGNTVSAYQKGGIVVNGVGASATVTNNVVTGIGPVSFIAQNGIQISRGATGDVSGNDISDNYYTGCSNQDAAKTGCTPWVSAGLLLYNTDPNSVGRSNNRFRGDQFNVLLVTPASLLHSGI